MGIRVGALKVFKATVKYSDSLPKTLFTIPRNHVVVYAFANVKTAWSSGAYISIGDDSDNDGLLTSGNTDVTTTGWKGLREDQRGAYLYDSGAAKSQIKVYTTATDIKAYGDHSGSSQGEMDVYVVAFDFDYI